MMRCRSFAFQSGAGSSLSQQHATPQHLTTQAQSADDTRAPHADFAPPPRRTPPRGNSIIIIIERKRNESAADRVFELGDAAPEAPQPALHRVRRHHLLACRLALR
eukprot:3941475-Rhodomonas_salina.1